MSYGYLGKVIRINLTTSSIIIEEKDDLFYRTHLGGKGIIAYYLLKEVLPGIDPMSPDNKMIFATGILTGAPVSGLSRFAVGAKSPLTGGFGQSEAGGFWGPELKRAGYDAIIIEGKAEKPVYIAICDETIEIKDAAHLWGKETGEAQDIIRKDMNDERVRVAQIGPGGENLVKYACIVNELKHFNGRNGLGTVMGSKNLKAVAVRGTKDIPFADSQKVREIKKKIIDICAKNPLSIALLEGGSSAGIITVNANGLLPTRNFIDGEFKDAENIGAEAMKEKILKKREGCYACAIRCKRAVEVKREDFTVDIKYGGPEYETLGALGSLCGIGDIELIAKFNEICNKFTIDTISTGCTIAFVMECFEKGILTKEDLGGVEARFGNADAVFKLIDMIIKREGIGDLLAEGSDVAAKKIGKGAEGCSMTVKGQEIALHDPRGKIGTALGYAVSENGPDHVVAAHDTLLTQQGFVMDSVAPLGIFDALSPVDISWKKVRRFTHLEYWYSFFNMAGVCIFGGIPRGPVPLDDIIDLIKAVTGWDTSLWEIMKAGERAANMARIYNIREGFDKEDDILPERSYEPIGNGKLKGTSISREKFAEAVSTYYSMMGWDEEGVPTKGKLLELNLEYLI